MAGAKIGYVRVSTVEQNSGRQLDGLELDKLFEDTTSGANKDRPGWDKCNTYLREGDTLYVHSIDRLARSLMDLHTIVKELNERGVQVRFVKEGLNFGENGVQVNAYQILHFQILGAFAQFERSIILERQREGIARAKAEGKYRGRRPKFSEEQKRAIMNDVALGIPKTKIAVKYGVTRPVIYTIINEVEGGQTAPDSVAV
jgi:DNA invertase Pin-like site-specific DNA recombinase